jgi:hypothetical protein
MSSDVPFVFDAYSSSVKYAPALNQNIPTSYDEYGKYRSDFQKGPQIPVYLHVDLEKEVERLQKEREIPLQPPNHTEYILPYKNANEDYKSNQDIEATMKVLRGTSIKDNLVTRGEVLERLADLEKEGLVLNANRLKDDPQGRHVQ